ncbi:MAG TPA: oxidoreductase, partial [Mycobacterium sp.]|nr:oxidoreductase [Mycobacterium sp.]
LDANGDRQRAHYDGLPVDFVAEAIATLGAAVQEDGYQTYHVLNPYDDGIGLDQFVDWLNAAGYPIQRIADYNDWLQRFETAMRALPKRQRQQSVLPLLHYWQEPEKPLRQALASTEAFRAAVQEAKVGPDKDIPHITADLIVKYITDLQLLGLV